ncbi:MAG: hypothetical protein KatS3mg108_2586 [Isosphaeraceae bacterium]|jgi:tetratricopeptide (TPR) repeat protein|nr:MAG: hypothetical protein KatS3mg108_2586 [Isosphaeraceae bacterium]
MSEDLPAPQGWDTNDLCFEDYRIEGLRGFGGCGEVYEAFSPSLNARFAVKRARRGAVQSPRAIEDELARLLELGDHPHLPRCANFARVGDEWVIASELITGEPVSEWCAAGRDLVEVLDTAIQAGWALAAVHELGWIHLDVKPKNLIRTPAGVVKLVDFGSCLPDAARLTPEEQAVLAVATCAATPEYESPFHPPEGPPSPLADLWSWGLTVFELFAGRPACIHGRFARSTFRRYLRRPTRLAVPPRVAQTIDRCFEPSGAGWTSMAEAAGNLVAAYRDLTGVEYPRARPPALRRREGGPLRRLGTITYIAPAQWATELCGGVPVASLLGQELDHILNRDAANRGAAARHSAPRAVAFCDMLDYGELERELERVTPATDEGLLYLGKLRLQRAAAHEAAGDIPGALAAYDRVITSLPPVPADDRLITLLADAFEAKAGAMTVQGDVEGALKLFPQAVALYRRVEARVDAGLLASVHANFALALRFAARPEQAQNECRAAIAAYERACPAGAKPARWHELAACYLLFARIRKDADDRVQAALYLNKATDIYSDLTGSEGGATYEPHFAECLVERSRLIQDGDERPAAPFDDRAVAIFERFKDELGRTEWRPHLARAYREQARRLGFDDRDVEAAEACERAVGVYRDLVELDGDRGYRFELASTCLHAGTLWMDAGDPVRGSDLVTRAVEILTRLVRTEGQTRHRLTLARALAVRARARGAPLDPGASSREVEADVAAAQAELAAAGTDPDPRSKPSFAREVGRVRAILEPLLPVRAPEAI